MRKFWVLYVEGTDGGQHYRHSTLETAHLEAERLAKKEQGKMVYVLECIEQCRVEPLPVIWEVAK